MMRAAALAGSCLATACGSGAVDAERVRDLPTNAYSFAIGDAIYSSMSGELEATDKETGHVRPLGRINPSVTLAVDQTYVYWTENNIKGGIGHASTDGSMLEIYVPGQAALALAVDDEAIYWATSGWTVGLGIYRLSHAGGAPALLTEIGGVVSKLLIEGGMLYWCEARLGGPDPCRSMDKRGGTPTTIFEEEDHGHWTVASDGLYFTRSKFDEFEDIFYVPPGAAPQFVTRIHGRVADDLDSLITLVRSPDDRAAYVTSREIVWLDGGAVAERAVEVGGTYLDDRLALDATHAYFVSQDALWRVPYPP
jgi:hypothetical protein